MADSDYVLWRCEMTHFGRVTKPAASFTATACLRPGQNAKEKNVIKACGSWKGRPWLTVSATCWPSLAICHLRRHTNRNSCQLSLALSRCGPFSRILLHSYQTLFIHKSCSIAGEFHWSWFHFIYGEKVAIFMNFYRKYLCLQNLFFILLPNHFLCEKKTRIILCNAWLFPAFAHLIVYVLHQ